MSVLGEIMGTDGVVGIARDAINKIWPDPAKAAEAALKLRELEQAGVFKQVDTALAAQQEQVKVILAEAQGQSWLQRNWRPLLMMTVMVIIANNYILAPYLQAIFGANKFPILPLPDQLWQLMNLGLGGYVVGRSAEKLMTTFKAKSQ